MASKPEHSLDKLPRWARWEIERLREEVKYLGTALAQVGAGRSGISWTYDREKYQYIPGQSVVRFVVQIPFGAEQLVPGDFDVKVVEEGMALEIHANDGGLLVEPRAANSVIVRGKKW